MNFEEIIKEIDRVKVVWNCHADSHCVGCPHKKWSKKQLYDALIQKMKFEQSGLSGTVLTK